MPTHLEPRMENTEELNRLEQDLNAVAGRLGEQVSWEELGPRVRWTLRRPTWALVQTIGLIVVCVAASFWTPTGWMVAGGLLMLVLPMRIREVRDRRRALTEAGEGDLLALVRRELELKLAHHFSQTLVAVALALIFVIVGLLVPDSRPGFIAAGVLVVDVVVRIFWRFPRAYRALREFERDEVAE